MNADAETTQLQWCNRKGIVNFCGGRVINTERSNIGKRQVD